ncbi:glycoside hydrolase family 88 protein [Synoicihabitans lomoniglobus]|uniref:Glycoside hydrolase family 88 protein n=1 Tax=Synoicihabitans lomoniglobus TaxID=2909285 RepID=A0AAE9ZU22_9BACT|nr:glycoside hydrolase family 88 protein [Opitutaceae bacterium LMO-M01]WED63281.1 glycoside hydrolase family 88 protein [Opitutaceae bacterium LMO-M01]
MRFLKTLSLLLLTYTSLLGQVPQFGGATPLEWSTRMAESERARYGETLDFEGAPRARWDYTSGLLSGFMLDLAETIGDDGLRDYAEGIVGSFVAPDGMIRTYKMSDYNIDMVTPGKVTLRLYERTGEERFKIATETIREQLRQHPRTREGGFWHKQRYPHQMWLDGLYMAAPFYAAYGKMFHEPAAYDDVASQILLIDRHTYVPEVGLHRHGWDEARAQSWADPQTGLSPNFWGRAQGWYAMALVDTLDFIPGIHHDVESIVEVLRRVAAGIERHQDPDTGVWWQVLDQPHREGNYLEATATSQFLYALAKAVNKGYLPRDRYEPVIRKGYAGLIEQFVRVNGEGLTDLTRCCAVAGLGYTNSAGRQRDGSFDYYISEPIIANDPKGTGPFIGAGIQVQQLLTTPVHATPLRVTGWTDYERVLARIKAPTFPDRDFPITDFGARVGGQMKATQAIADAIAAAHAAGGGRVVVPAGEWLTGAIHLQSNVNLHVSAGAVLKFSTDPADYPTVYTRWEGVECMNYSPLIYAWKQQNIAVTGEGTLDGQADWDNWWGWNRKTAGQPTQQVTDRNRLIAMGENDVPVAERVFGAGTKLRPNFIQPYHCENILIEGVTILRSPMWEVHPVLSRNITVRGLNIVSHGPNNDGCNPESSQDVLIEDCVFDTGDDCIAIKSGRNNDGRRVNVASENIIVRNSTMKDGHGGVVLGSECSGHIRNVFVENCTMDSPNLDRALRFKNNAVRGGILENVFMRNVTVGTVAEAVLTIDLMYEEGPRGDHLPIVRNVEIDNVTSSASPRIMFVQGFEGAVVENIRFKNSTFSGVTATDVLNHAGKITFENVTIAPAEKVRGRNSVPPPPEPAQP